MPYQAIVSAHVLAAGTAAERADIDAGFAGQGLGLIYKVRPAREVLLELATGAEEALKHARNFISGQS
jgi:nitronate monooxygenase